jgi:D-alanyl-D-alanine carboxypeptidase
MNTLIKEELNALQQQYGFPGATCAYILPDGTLNAIAIGLADVEKKIAMTSKHRMLAASIGKSFVAAIILQLSKENRLHLEDTLSKWLGNRQWFSRLPNHLTITLRHLLTHSAGLLDHVRMQKFLDFFSKHWKEPGKLFEPEALVSYILDQPPLFEPGTGWLYTDTGYILLGIVIETLTQNTYYHELEDRFLKPLNLKNTSPSNTKKIQHLAAGYTMPNNAFGLPTKTLTNTKEMIWNPNFEWTGGGVVSSSKDLALWAKLLFEGKAMKEDYLQDLLNGVPTSDDTSDLYYGTGIVISKKDPKSPIYGHWGIIPGYTSSMRYFPKNKTSYAFQINTDIGVSDHSTNLIIDTENRLDALLFN